MVKKEEYEMELTRFVKHEPFETVDGELLCTGTGYYSLKGKKKNRAVKLSVVFSMSEGFEKEKLSKIFVRFEKKI